MADVFRRGRKDVHRAIVSGDPDDPMRPNGCNLDSGGAWGPVVPPGPRCSICFAALSEQRRSSRGRGKAPFLGMAAALALATAVVASSLGEPVNLFPTASGGPAFPLATVTPGPSRVPPTPSAAPALTPAPSLQPLESVSTLPTFGPVPTYPPAPTFPPVPTWPPLPTLALPPLPDPTLPPIVKACVHPGTHLGVDACRWPHN